MVGQSLSKRLAKAKQLDGGTPVAIGVVEAAARLRVGRSKIQQLIAEKKIRSFKIGRQVRISIKAIEEYIERASRG